MGLYLTMPPADLSLTEQQVRAAQRGDEQALEDLLRRHIPRVRRIVASRTRKSLQELREVDDIVQDTFRDAVAGLQRFEYASEGAFCHWLAQCVENNVRDAVRRGLAERRGQGRVRAFSDLADSSLTDSIFQDAGPTPSELARTKETEDLVEQAVLRLNDRYREVINLRVHCQLSYREIAQMMGLPTENTANLLFMRARDKLRQFLEGKP